MARHLVAGAVSHGPATRDAWSKGNSNLKRAVVLLGLFVLVLVLLLSQYSTVAPHLGVEPPDLEDGLASNSLSASDGHVPADLMPQATADHSRDEAPSFDGDNRDVIGTRKLFLQVVDHQSSNGLPVRVELLFGEQQNARSIPLFLDRNGLAAWPSSSQSPRPWFVDFAFPTVQVAGRRLAAEAEHAEMALMPTCVLDIEVVELDGRATADPVTVRLRSTQTVWPMNRWHSIHMVGGRARVLAEAAGERIEIQVETASGRNVEAVCLASNDAGERVSVSVQLPSVDGLNVDLSGLPTDLDGVSHEWLVELHSLRGESASGHRLSDEGQSYKFFTPKLVRDRVSRWLVIASRASHPDEAYWGYRDAYTSRATMQSLQLLGSGRCVDAFGAGLTGYHVDLTVRESGAVLATAVSDTSGNFRLFGPDSLGLQLMAVLREAQNGQPNPVPLPATEVIKFQFGQ